MSLFPVIGGFGLPPYVADGVNYASTPTRRTTTITSTNSKFQTLSFWFRITVDPTSGNRQIFQTGGDTGCKVMHLTDGKIEIFGHTTTGYAQILNIKTSTVYKVSTNAGWHHLFLSCNMNGPTVLLYVDGADDKDSTTETDAEFDHDTVYADRFTIGCNRLGTDSHDGIDLFDFWYDTTEFVDFTNAAVRAKWIDGSGKPVDLGATGELPTAGGQPEVFCHIDDGETAGNFDTNAGSAGAINGNGNPTLATSSTSPTD